MTQPVILNPEEYCFGQGAKGFITLWKCYQYGATYIKTVAKTQEKADELYPGLTQRHYIGTRVFFGDSSRASVSYDGGVFLYGKYNRCLLKDCTDYSYLMWYMTTIPADSKDYETIYEILEKVCHHMTDEEKALAESVGYPVPDFLDVFIPTYFGISNYTTWEQFIERCNRRKEIREKRDSLLDKLNSGEDVDIDIKYVTDINSNSNYYYGVKLSYNLFIVIRDIECIRTYYGINYYVTVNGKRKRFTKHNCTLTDIEYVETICTDDTKMDDGKYLMIYEATVKSINDKLVPKEEA